MLCATRGCPGCREALRPPEAEEICLFHVGDLALLWDPNNSNPGKNCISSSPPLLNKPENNVSIHLPLFSAYFYWANRVLVLFLSIPFLIVTRQPSRDFWAPATCWAPAAGTSLSPILNPVGHHSTKVTLSEILDSISKSYGKQISLFRYVLCDTTQGYITNNLCRYSLV